MGRGCGSVDGRQMFEVPILYHTAAHINWAILIFRELFRRVSSPKVQQTNLKCKVKAQILDERVDPTVEVAFSKEHLPQCTVLYCGGARLST